MTFVSTDIEDVILDHDKRGISALRPHLPAGYIDEAARLILDNPGTALIVTGFYIMWADAPENDGPPGAVVIGNALRALGNDVVYVSDHHSTSIVEGLVDDGSTVAEFPFLDDAGSAQHAAGLLSETEPSVVISIERCGPSEDGKARNMRNADITEFNAKTDYLFTGGIPSVGIGDGGNEIGMGNSLPSSRPCPPWSKNPASPGSRSRSSPACRTGAATASWPRCRGRRDATSSPASPPSARWCSGR